MLLASATLTWEQGARSGGSLKDAENRKKGLLQTHRREADRPSPPAQAATGPEEHGSSRKAVLHDISFVVRKVGVGSGWAPSLCSV